MNKKVSPKVLYATLSKDSEAIFVNIDESDDPFYRYTMPKLRLEHKGRSKMTRTVFTNNKDVTKKLRIPEDALVSYIGYELCTKYVYDQNSTYLSGHHTEHQISKCVSKFIHTLLLCAECGLPELTLNIHNSKVSTKCDSCGFRSEPRHLNSKYVKHLTKWTPKTKNKCKKTAKEKRPHNVTSDCPTGVVDNTTIEANISTEAQSRRRGELITPGARKLLDL